MTTFEIICIILFAVVVLLEAVILFRGTDSKNDSSGTEQVKTMLADSEKRICDEIEDLQKSESLQFSDMKASVSQMQGNVGEKITDRFSSLRESLGEYFADMTEMLNRHMKESMENQSRMDRTLSESLLRIQTMTEEKLDTIQKNVNDKLDASLNRRLDESFEKVTTQLGQLYRSLGELGEMSDGISSLNRTLSNVKTRGTWGEIQLGSIIEETMSPSQYEHNIKLNPSSDDIVEYALKIPSKEDDGVPVYLPIDSKFPMDIYGALVDAGEAGDRESYARAEKELERRIKDEAKTIRDKYVNPPKTTDFAVMFLPTESMYAEVFRINGLAEFCQNRYRVVIAGPSTITALLNSLRVGFANVAVNKKTAEIQHLLSAIKTQYTRLDELIDKAKRQIELASKSTDELKKRTGIIRRRMASVTEIEGPEADSLLGIAEDE